jgi:hypothetical protein
VSAALSSAAFGYGPSGELQLLSVALGLLAVVLLLGWTILVITQGLRRRPIALAGLLTAVLGFGSCLGARDAGRALADRRFRADLAAYEQVVATLRQQPLRSLRPIPPDSLPAALRSRVSQVMSWRGPRGEFGVDFHYGGGYPVKHSAYVYYEGEARRLGPESPFRWRRGRELAPRWFAVSD